MRRTILALGASVTTTLSVIAGAPAQAAPTPASHSVAAASTATPRAASTFAQRYEVNAAGDLEITGNTLMTCAASASGCGTAQQTSASNSKLKLNNNDYSMQWVDVDTDPTTANSSAADLVIPTGAPVLFAGLYWSAGASGDQAKGTPPANGNQVKFKAPNASGYAALTADKYYTISTSGSNKTYAAFKDVTSIVKPAGRGQYMVGGVAGDINIVNHFAGWSLVVVYADPSEPVRAMSVYDGIASVSSGSPATINVSGFKTPPTGPVRTELGFVAYEGDLNLTGDQFTLDGKVLSDSPRPADNFFKSSVTNQYGFFTKKNPNYPNQLGFDTGVIDAAGLIKNGATSAQFTATSTGDQYYPAALTFSTELFSPRYEAVKSVTDVSGSATTRPGDTLAYDLVLTNNATAGDGDASAKTVIADDFPAGTTYVPGSLTIDGKPVADSDPRVTLSAQKLTLRVGTGASGTSGGTLAIGASVRIGYRLTVNAGVAAGTQLANDFFVSGQAATSGFDVTGASNEAVITVEAAQAGLSISKTAIDQDPLTPGTIFVAGNLGRYTIKVTNSGPGAADDVVVDDTLPAGFANAEASGTDWSCDTTGSSIHCEYTAGALGAGRTAPTITVSGVVPSNAVDGSTLTNVARATTSTPGSGDAIDDATSTVQRQADLYIKKRHEGTPTPGADFTYTINVGNAGPSVATGVTVTDTLPASLTLVSASGDGWTCDAAITCTLGGELAPGAAAETITIVATVDNDAAGTITNTAEVDANERDPSIDDNRSTDTSDSQAEVDLIESVIAPVSAVAGGAPVPVNVRAYNAGPSPIPAGSEVTHTVSIPDGTTFAGVSGSAWTCAPANATGPATLTCTTTLDSDWIGGTEVDELVLRVSVDAGETGPKTVSAVVGTDADVTELNPDNNRADDDIMVDGSADLALTTTSSAALVAGGTGQPLTFTVTNNGPSLDPGPITVAFPAPEGITFDPPASGPWTCTITTSLITCVLAGSPLAAGDSAPPLTLTASAPDPSTEPMLTGLTGVVSSPTPDDNPDNDSATAPIRVTTFADIWTTKTANPARIQAGDTTTFTLMVSNGMPYGGPSDARNVFLRDDVGALGLTIESIKVTDGSLDCKESTDTIVSCQTGRLTFGDRAVVQVTVRTPRDWVDPGHTVVNAVTATTSTPDSRRSPETAELVTDPYSTLAIAKSVEGVDAGGRLEPGANVVYRLDVTNTGPSDATGATVTDTLPESLTPLLARGDDWTCDIAGQKITCTTTATIAADAGASPIEITTALDPDAVGTITNTATVTPQSPGEGGSDTTSNPVNDVVDLDIAHYGTTSLSAGDSWKTHVSVRNNGPAREKGPITVVIKQDGATPVKASGDGWACSVSGSKVTCVWPKGLSAGATLPTIDIASDTPGSGTFATSTATVSGTSEDSDLSNNTSTTTVVLTRNADIAITKEIDQVNVVSGEQVRFTLTLTNNGPGSADAAQANDLLPSGLSFVQKGSDPRCAAESGQVTCSAENTLRKGDSTSFTIVAQVAPNAVGKRTNVATGSSLEPDPDPSNNVDKVNFTIIPTITPQVPLIDPPDKIKNQGETVIYPEKVPTNADQYARIRVTCTPLVMKVRGDFQDCRITRSRAGAVFIFVPGNVALQVKIRATAPEVPGYTNMSYTYTYTTKRVKKSVS